MGLLDGTANPEQIDGLDGLLAKILELRAAKRTLDADVKEINGRLKELEAQLISTLDDLGLTSLKAAGGAQFIRSTKLRARVINHDEAHDWLRAQGLGALIQPKVAAQTLEAALRERREEQMDDPPDCIGLWEQDTLSVRGGR